MLALPQHDQIGRSRLAYVTTQDTVDLYHCAGEHRLLLPGWFACRTSEVDRVTCISHDRRSIMCMVDSVSSDQPLIWLKNGQHRELFLCVGQVTELKQTTNLNWVDSFCLELQHPMGLSAEVVVITEDDHVYTASRFSNRHELRQEDFTCTELAPNYFLAARKVLEQWDLDSLSVGPRNFISHEQVYKLGLYAKGSLMKSVELPESWLPKGFIADLSMVQFAAEPSFPN